MHDISDKIERAKKDDDALDSLIQEYMPFIRQESGRYTSLGIEYDDRVSLGMLTFAHCVQYYQIERGNFLSYVSVAIRNRLIDESRRLGRDTQRLALLENDGDDEKFIFFQEKAALHAHEKQRQQAALAEEIALLNDQLSDFNIQLDELDKLCPKHARLRSECIDAAHALAQDPVQAVRLRKTKRLPVTWLTEEFQIPVKTLDKFRKYLITIAVILMGDYPYMREFLPKQGSRAWKGMKS